MAAAFPSAINNSCSHFVIVVVSLESAENSTFDVLNFTDVLIMHYDDV